MSGMFPVASFPCICYRTEDYHCVSVSHLFGSSQSQSIFTYEWPRLSVALTAAITFSLSAVIWAACQFDFACVPVDVRVVLHKPGVPQDDCLMANAQDIEFGLALMTIVLDNEIDRFSDLSDLVW